MLIRYGDEPQLSHLTILCNTGDGGVFSNVTANLGKGYARIEERKVTTRPVLICGSGPSLKDTLENIRVMQKRGAFVMALNGAARCLSEAGIKPDAMVMVDPRPENIGFVGSPYATEAWMASQVHPSVIECAEASGMTVRLWNPGIPHMQNHIPAKDSLRIGGGITVGLSSLSLAYAVGFREMHLFGYDSSHREGRGHAFQQDMNNDDELVNCTVESRQFVCSVAMAAQVAQWNELHKWLLNEGCEIHVHGEGLLPTLWRIDQRKRRLRVLQAVYDLGVSPPTYDFISFLAEAERHRIANGFDLIDLTFQPGPMHGFRADDLPPDVPTRKGMLWRVCVGIARLLPSVRHIEVLGDRKPVVGDVFPVGWAEDNPTSHYGTMYLKGGAPILRSSDYAKTWAKNRIQPYATITIRESSYHPARNSNIKEWLQVASWLSDQGIQPVFIPDTAATDALHYAVEAAFDIDLRAALYEGALINLGVSNGPMYLLPYLEARYLIFGICNDSVHSSSTEFLLSHGITKGDESVFGGDGKVIWEPDSAEVIIRELKAFLTTGENLNGNAERKTAVRAL